MHVKDLHLSKQEREERGLFMRQKNKKAELVPKQNQILLESFLLEGRKGVFIISGHCL